MPSAGTVGSPAGPPADTRGAVRHAAAASRAIGERGHTPPVRGAASPPRIGRDRAPSPPPQPQRSPRRPSTAAGARIRALITRPAAGAAVAGRGEAHIGARSDMVNNVGLLCLIIDSGKGGVVTGRVRLQKAAYFCQYLGWPLRDYRLHYYGPYSQTLAETVADAESSGLISQSDGDPRRFSLTDAGREVLVMFVEKACDRDKVDKTRRLAGALSGWPRADLELAATIDYVASGSSLSKGDLLDKVRSIKPAHRMDSIARAHAAWKKLVRDMDVPIGSVRW